MKTTFAVVGSINQDVVVRSFRIPRQGETVFGESVVNTPGGKGANQAVALARLGTEVLMVGCLGSDVTGRELQTYLDAQGVRTQGIVTTPSSSGIALIQIERDGENRITLIPGANAALGSEHLDQHWTELSKAAMILTQLETPMPTTVYLARRCKAERVPLMLDPAPAERLSPELLRALTWLTPNLSEAQTLLGSTDVPSTPIEARNMAERLLDRGPEGVLLKLGAMGMAAARRGETSCFREAMKIRVVDTTAAGDAANAAFASAITDRLPLPEALRFAAAAGAVCVSRHGAQEAMPTRAEIESLLSKQA